MEKHSTKNSDHDSLGESETESLRSASKSAIVGLYGECRNYLLLIANRQLPQRIQSKVSASDVVQETLAEAVKLIDRFQGNTQQELRAWLAKILEFKLAQAQRRFTGTEMRDVRREVPLDEVSPELLPQTNSSSDSFAEKLNHELALQAAIARLPNDYRIAIELRSLQRRPFAELAERLNRSTEAVRRLWLRAVVRLRTELAGQSSDVIAVREHDKQQSKS